MIEIGQQELPNSKDVENSLLGACLLDSNAKLEIVNECKPDYFYDLGHKTIFEVIMSMTSNDIPLDVVTLSQELIKINKLDYIGGMIAISELSDNTITAANYKIHLQTLKDYYIRRLIIKHCYGAYTKAYALNTDINELILSLQDLAENTEKLNEVKVYNNKEIALMVNNQIEKYSKKEMLGISTGLRQLDKYLQGGVQNGDLIVVAARTSVGKTAFVVNWINSIKCKIGFFSLEQSAEQIALRLAINKTEISKNKIKGFDGGLKLEDYTKLTEFGKTVYNADNLFIIDKPSWEVNELRNFIKLQMKKHQFEILFIDYLQLIKCKDKTVNNRVSEVDTVTKYLKTIARENNIPVVAIAQLNRETESTKGQRPLLKHLQESGGIEQSADVVLLLFNAFLAGIKEYKFKNETYSTENKIEVILAKNREGEKDVSEICIYKPEYFSFKSIEYNYKPDCEQIGIEGNEF
jgi:replicative DNA helicase